MAYTLKPICFDLKFLCFSNSSPLTCVVGVLPPPGRGLQLWEQRTDWPAGDCSRHSDCDCNQSGAFEEETVRYHQSWHRGGEPAIDYNVPLRHKQTSNKTHTVWFTWSWMVVEVSSLCAPPHPTGWPNAVTGGTPSQQDAEPRLWKPHLQIPGANADLSGADRGQQLWRIILLTNNLCYW